MNGMSNFDKTDREYSLAPTDDLIRFWRSKFKGQGHNIVTLCHQCLCHHISYVVAKVQCLCHHISYVVAKVFTSTLGCRSPSSTCVKWDVKP